MQDTNPNNKHPRADQLPMVADTSSRVIRRARKNLSRPSEDRIAERAYEIWRTEGCCEGQAQDHWLRAEKELQSRT